MSATTRTETAGVRLSPPPSSPLPPPVAEAPVETPYPRPAYAWYVVGVLTVAYVSSFIDRQILSLLVAPIRRDLAISDTGMSLLMGLSFALFYTLLGLPIGRLADGHSRRGIMAAGVAVWSVMTALCGFAQSFFQFFLARTGVGVGEAALSPPAYSLLADYFPRDRLATALSVYSSAIYMGSGLAFVIGGLVIGLVSGTGTMTLPLVGEVRPWQTVFFAVGLPGLLIALLFATVREPVRRGATKAALPLAATVRYVRENLRTFGGHHFGVAFISLAAYSANAWLPTVFVRTYGWQLPRVGLVLGLMIMVFGTLGIIAGGRFADHLLARGHADAKMRAMRVGALGFLVCVLPLPFVSSGMVAAMLLVPVNFFAAFPYGAAPAAVQELAPNRMRAQVSALYLFVVNLIGLGFGPTTVALVTDYGFKRDDAVVWSLTIVIVAALSIASLLLSWGRGSYARTLAYRDSWLAANAGV